MEMNAGHTQSCLYFLMSPTAVSVNLLADFQSILHILNLVYKCEIYIELTSKQAIISRPKLVPMKAVFFLENCRSCTFFFQCFRAVGSTLWMVSGLQKPYVPVSKGFLSMILP